MPNPKSNEPNTVEEIAAREVSERFHNDLMEGIDDHAGRMREVLIALKMAGIPLNYTTGAALHELSLNLQQLMAVYVSESPDD